MATLAAYYYPATKAQRARGIPGRYELHRLENGRREIVSHGDCDSKADARFRCTLNGATPWNF